MSMLVFMAEDLYRGLHSLLFPLPPAATSGVHSSQIKGSWWRWRWRIIHQRQKHFRLHPQQRRRRDQGLRLMSAACKGILVAITRWSEKKHRSAACDSKSQQLWAIKTQTNLYHIDCKTEKWSIWNPAICTRWKKQTNKHKPQRFWSNNDRNCHVWD